jgi:propanol-preferring alcohol dehydrogenase
MAETMRAMVLEAAGGPLVERERPRPVPGSGEVVVRVEACAVCRTDLHIVDGELRDGVLPIVPGHEVVGRVVALGDAVEGRHVRMRVGIPWLARTCGGCPQCRAGRENLCPSAQFTGFHLDGGFAEYVRADARFVYELPDDLDAERLAPLLCAGLIGYRSLKMAGPARALGIYGFGAAAHIIAQVARARDVAVYAFTRPGDLAAQAFARTLGASWAGEAESRPPVPLDAAIIFAPVGELVPRALAAVRPGGRVVCGGIHMSDIPSFPYALLWGERDVCSVANLTRADGEEFFALLREVPVSVTIEPFPLAAANEALDRLRRGTLTGAAVLVPGVR